MTEPHTTIRYSGNGKSGRITYRPDWSESLPWASYINGTAGLHFTNTDDADEYMAKHKLFRTKD